MKIDIEGFELNAIRSLGDRLSDGSIDNIIVELHPAQLERLGQSVDEVRAVLSERGYCRQANPEVEHWRRRERCE